MRYRWDELHIEEWRASDDIADLVEGLYGTTDILPSKNAIATLIAEVLFFLFLIFSPRQLINSFMSVLFCGYLSPGYFIHVSVLLQASLSGGISLLNDLLPSIIVLANRGPTEVSLTTNEVLNPFVPCIDGTEIFFFLCINC